jgi:hypothetical protein
MDDRPAVKRSVSFRNIAKFREDLFERGSIEELTRYLTDQIRRFTRIENQLDAVGNAAHRTYVLSHTRSPSLQRKTYSQTSVDTTIARLLNYSKIKPDKTVSELFEQLYEVLAPVCDREQLLSLEMVGEKLVKIPREKAMKKKSKKKNSIEEQLVIREEVVIEEVPDIDQLIVSRGNLRKDAETVIAPLLPIWLAKESPDNFLRENTELRRTIRLFLKHLVMKKQNYTTAEGFLRAIPKFPSRLKDFLQMVQTYAEERGLEDPDNRGHKLVITVIHTHFIPQLPLTSQAEAGRSLVHHIQTNSEAFRRAIAIFTWN